MAPLSVDDAEEGAWVLEPALVAALPAGGAVAAPARRLAREESAGEAGQDADGPGPRPVVALGIPAGCCCEKGDGLGAKWT